MQCCGVPATLSAVSPGAFATDQDNQSQEIYTPRSINWADQVHQANQAYQAYQANQAQQAD